MSMESSDSYENGDLFDNDNGEYYGRLTAGIGDEIKGPPANMAVYYNGFWYNYKMESREDATKSVDPANLQQLNDVDKLENL